MSLLESVRAENPDLAQVLDEYSRIEQVYMEAVAAITPQESVPAVASSKDVTVEVEDVSTVNL